MSWPFSCFCSCHKDLSKAEKNDLLNLEEWLEFSSTITYADDTSTSISDEGLELVISRFEINVVYVQKFMASNGLVKLP